SARSSGRAASVRLARVEERQDVRMPQVGRRLDLASEAARPEERADVRMEHLERDRAPVADVAREVHGGHPTATELTLDDVPSFQRGREARRVGRAQLDG